jgi:phosphoribosylformylglycinamidine synthase
MVLFGEGPGGFVVSGAPETLDALAAEATDVPFVRLGTVGGEVLKLAGSDARLSLPVEALRSAYEQALPELLS